MNSLREVREVRGQDFCRIAKLTLDANRRLTKLQVQRRRSPCSFALHIQRDVLNRRNVLICLPYAILMTEREPLKEDQDSRCNSLSRSVKSEVADSRSPPPPPPPSRQSSSFSRRTGRNRLKFIMLWQTPPSEFVEHEICFVVTLRILASGSTVSVGWKVLITHARFQIKRIRLNVSRKN